MSEQSSTTYIPEWTAADRFRKARESAGLSQVELADRMGVNKNTIGNHENGHTTNVRRIMFTQWALATGVPVEWLRDGVAPTDGPAVEAREQDESPTKWFVQAA